MGEERIPLPHRLTLDGRQKLTVTGVTEVIRFDENAVVLRTELGILTVQGETLVLKQLTREAGQMQVEGTVTAAVYEEPRGRGWLRRRLGG